MGHGGELPDGGLSGLDDLLRTSLGIDDADRLVGSLSALSARLWTPPQDGLLEQETFHSIAPESEAVAVLRLLAAHGGRVDPWPADRLAAQDFEPVYGWRWEATAVLVTGALALGVSGQRPFPDLDRALDTLLHVAFGNDELTWIARRAILVGAGDPWPPPFPGDDWPDLGVDCLGELRAAGARLATSVSVNRRTEVTVTVIDADGIASLSPAGGSCSDPVAILGTFPAAARTVLFPRAGEARRQPRSRAGRQSGSTCSHRSRWETARSGSSRTRRGRAGSIPARRWTSPTRSRPVSARLSPRSGGACRASRPAAWRTRDRTCRGYPAM
jgi:hypothetical protein